MAEGKLFSETHILHKNDKAHECLLRVDQLLYYFPSFPKIVPSFYRFGFYSLKNCWKGGKISKILKKLGKNRKTELDSDCRVFIYNKCRPHTSDETVREP